MFKMSNNKKGTYSMLISSFNYALYPVLISLALFVCPNESNSMGTKFLWGFTLVGIKELLNLVFQLIYMTIKGTIEENSWIGIFSIFKIYKRIANKYLSNKYGWMIVGAAVLAGPIGYSIETTGIIMAGPSIGTLLVNLTPIFVVILTKWLFKNKKITPLTIVLISIFIITVLSNSIGQYLTASAANKEHIAIALATGIIVAILWAFENVIMAYVSKKQKMDHNDVVTIKLTASAIIVPLLLIPIVGAWHGSVIDGYSWYAMLWTSSEWIPWLFGIGFVMFIARWSYFYSIKNSTTMVSSLTLVIRFAWVPILQIILIAIAGRILPETNWYIFIPLSIFAWILVGAIILHDSWIESGNEYKGFKDSLQRIFEPLKSK